MAKVSKVDASEPRLIAIDWGTSRFRAYLVDGSGAILKDVASDDGMATVRDGKFAAVLLERCGAWLDRHADVPVLMSGMVGSRNGWKEAPYVPCPASLEEIRGAIQPIEIKDGRFGGIVPGIIYHEDGVADVIRGEETKILGTGGEDGLIVMPGTHCKWAWIEGGKIARFQSYMTGEFYGLLRENSILRLLAKEPEDSAGFRRGLEAARRHGGLLHQAFAARTAVLDDRMTGEEVAPFLSGLLIAHEIAGAAKDIARGSKLKLVAEGVLCQNYEEALRSHGLEPQVISPRDCFVKGMLRLIPEAQVR
jgi:2-dehydro-3-deoxygalactonokinase